MAAKIAAVSKVKPMIQRRRLAGPGSMRPNSGAPNMPTTDSARATLPLCTSDIPWRSISKGPSHSPRNERKEAYVTLASATMPIVCGSLNNSP